MSTSSSVVPPPPQFTGENYHIWSVKMKTHLQAHHLWEIVDTGREPERLRGNPTIAQMKQHAEEVAKRFQAMAILQNSVSDVIFTRIMTCETPKAAWDLLKQEFQGSERTKKQQVVNLRRDFENLRIKEDETVKQYSDRVAKVVNKLKLLGNTAYIEKRVVEKSVNTLPEKYEPQFLPLKTPKTSLIFPCPS